MICKECKHEQELEESNGVVILGQRCSKCGERFELASQTRRFFLFGTLAAIVAPTPTIRPKPLEVYTWAFGTYYVKDDLYDGIFRQDAENAIDQLADNFEAWSRPTPLPKGKSVKTLYRFE